MTTAPRGFSRTPSEKVRDRRNAQRTMQGGDMYGDGLTIGNDGLITVVVVKPINIAAAGIGLTIDASYFAITSSELTIVNPITDVISSSSTITTTSTVTADTLILNKASGKGIKVDTASPTFGFRDLLGDMTAKNVGASKPTHTTFRDGLLAFRFGAGDEEYFQFHIPHDYAQGTDIFLHFHWGHNSALVTGGSITLEYEASYSNGHDGGAFPASVSGTVVGAASLVQYRHILTEVQISAASPSASQLDSDDFEPDGVIMMTSGVFANNITSSGGVPDPFIFYVDIHYQSTNVGTKDKAPDFYA